MNKGGQAPYFKVRLFCFLFGLLFCLSAGFLFVMPVKAAAVSNADPDWPQAPENNAEGAILIDAASGTVLYGKNTTEKLYPASTTKMMTCLLITENLQLDDTITITQNAIDTLPPGSSNIGLDPGQSISVEEALYGILVGSANEVATSAAEKIAGTLPAFADMMNAKAAELGCVNTHFVNANGLHDDDHYTCPRDLALIARAFFDDPVLLRMGNTPTYHFLPTATQPDDFVLTNKHKLITGEVACEGVIGGKTGYTGKAGECLVTGCERGGMRLICVVMNEPDPDQYSDSAKLLDFGFANFSKVPVAGNETRFTFSESSFLESGSDLLGNSVPLFSLSDDSVILPVNRTFTDLTPTVTAPGTSDTAAGSADADAISADPASETASGSTDSSASDSGSTAVATITYRFHDTVVGSAQLLLKNSAISSASGAASDGKNTSGVSGNAGVSGTSGGPGTSEGSVFSGFSPASAVSGFFMQIKNALHKLRIFLYRKNEAGTLYINVPGFAAAAGLVGAVAIAVILLAGLFNSYTHPNRRQKRRPPRQDAEFTHDRFRKYDRIDDSGE
jgi:D-alanyl-D-alanine carboxypeptidase